MDVLPLFRQWFRARNKKRSRDPNEVRAERYLRRRGLKTVVRNYTRRCGEIDLIMLDGPVLVFVEVRFRGRTAFTTGAESVDRNKQRRIARTARMFLGNHPQYSHRPTRFDVVSISKTNYRFTQCWIADAFIDSAE
ncbi:MAG: YraN family protein [Gammaproteobacteria bacterium]|nr:YraN family protein [Gammaproteobacteria bacterium]